MSIIFITIIIILIKIKILDKDCGDYYSNFNVFFEIDFFKRYLVILDFSRVQRTGLCRMRDQILRWPLMYQHKRICFKPWQLLPNYSTEDWLQPRRVSFTSKTQNLARNQ